MTIPVSEIAQQRTVRLVPTAYYKPAVIRSLVDTDEEYRLLTKIEGQTSRRLRAPTVGGLPNGWGKTYIDAAFSYRRKGGNRFNDEHTGAWYAGFDDRTSLAEVAFHKTRELAYIDYFVEKCVYVALHASFIGRFHDVRSLIGERPYLDPAIEIGHPAGQQLAKALIAQASRGLIYPSVRNAGGTCIVSFEANAVQDVAPGARWQIEWSGTPNWTATAA